MHDIKHPGRRRTMTLYFCCSFLLGQNLQLRANFGGDEMSNESKSDKGLLGSPEERFSMEIGHQNELAIWQDH